MSYDALHLALMRGFLILGAIAAFFVIVMCLVALISAVIDRVMHRPAKRAFPANSTPVSHAR